MKNLILLIVVIIGFNFLSRNSENFNNNETIQDRAPAGMESRLAERRELNRLYAEYLLEKN